MHTNLRSDKHYFLQSKERMNLSLLDPFAVAKEYPESLTQSLTYGHSVVIQFSHKGDYLALGLADGSIVIYDLVCNGGIITHLYRNGHLRPITSLSWSRCGRYLLSTSQDWTIKLWDLSMVNQGDDVDPVIRTVTFDGPVWSAVLHPKNPFLFVASLFEDSAAVVDMTDDIKISRLSAHPKGQEDSKDKHLTLTSVFTPDEEGSYIFAGTSKGWINIFDLSTLNKVHSVKVANANIKNVVISPNGRKLAVNASDRIIRQINLSDIINTAPEEWEFEVEHKYQDVVNRLQWNTVAFNHNGDFLCASTFGQLSQDLYVWETSLGSLIKILEGSSEELVDLKWNYPRCMIGSTGLDSGTIYLWLVPFPQKWSALAPDFVEIEENIEYEEKEDEFDIIDDDLLNKKRLQEEDLQVDVLLKELVDARGFTVQEAFVIPVDYERKYGA